MHLDVLKKLWVSCHLLFPNSSQAKDVFSRIIEREKLIDIIIGKSVQCESTLFSQHSRLFKIYKSENIVKSGSPYSAFNNISLGYWKKVPQKCNQLETFILILILAHGASFLEVAKLVRLPVTRIKYLLNHSIRKVLNLNVTKLELKKELKLREYEDNETSLMFINEHLIEYILGESDAVSKTQMEKKINENIRFVNFKNEILSFQKELSNLTLTIKTFDDFINELTLAKSYKADKKINISGLKYGSVLGVFLIIFCVVLIMRPSVLNNSNSSEKNKVVLEEISIVKDTLSENSSQIEGSNNMAVQTPPRTNLVSSTSAVSKSVAMKENAQSQVKQISEAVATQNSNMPKTPEEQLLKSQKEVSKPIESAKLKSSGVYRGSMSVIDFEMISDSIKNKIIEIGGKKAGEVELGWIKNKNTSYYHFLFPVDKKEELVKFIESYGKLNYQHEKHPRLLPDGYERFIIEIHKNGGGQ